MNIRHGITILFITAVCVSDVFSMHNEFLPVFSGRRAIGELVAAKEEVHAIKQASIARCEHERAMHNQLMALCDLEDHQEAVEATQRFIDKGEEVIRFNRGSCCTKGYNNHHLSCKKENTLFHKACARGNLSLVKLLLHNGLGVRVVDCRGLTALHYACKAKNEKVIRLLLEMGASLHDCDTNGSFSGRLGSVRLTPYSYLSNHSFSLLKKELFSDLIYLFYALFSGHENPKSDITKVLPKKIIQKIQEMYFDIADPIMHNKMRVLKELSEGPRYTTLHRIINTESSLRDRFQALQHFGYC